MVELVHVFLQVTVQEFHVETGTPKFQLDILVGGVEHFLFSPIVGMMIQSD